MRNIKLEIEYDGTDYCGWQVQHSSQFRVQGSGSKVRHKVNTIQAEIEKVLLKVLRERVKVIASGRTDSGVHAFGQTANFKTASKLPLKNIHKALNSLLPEGIKIRETSEVPEDFHSRYCVSSKTYRYLIYNNKIPSVFLSKYSWFIPYELNIRDMHIAAQILKGRHDFKSFCASPSSVKTTTRKIIRLDIKTIDCELFSLKHKLIAIEIEADGFLYNMVRNIAGTLVEIGRGKLKKTSLKMILKARDRRLAGPVAPARGLFLVRVRY